ncbi:unnamed protein product [Urochloa humidicola]
MSISSDGLSMVTSPPELLEKLDLFPRNCTFSRLPDWIKHLDKLRILKVAVRELLPPSVDLLKGLNSLTALSVHVRVNPAANSIVIGQEGFPVLRHFTFRCALVCLLFHKGAMPNVQRLKLGFCVDKEGLSSYAEAGLDHLCSLKEISAIVWHAGAGDSNSRVAEESCLKAVTRKSVRPPILNIKWVRRPVPYGGKYYHDMCSRLSKVAADDMMFMWTTVAPCLIPSSSPDTGEEACSSYTHGIEEKEGFLHRWNPSSSLSSFMTADFLYAVDKAMLDGYSPERAVEYVIKMEWSVVHQNMRQWRHAIWTAVRTFLGEERLIDGKSNQELALGPKCFADIARGCVLQLLGFADAVAKTANTHQRLFRTIGMYEKLANVQAELEALFAKDEASEFLADEVARVVKQLGSTVRDTVEDFGRLISAEDSRKAVPGGEIHPMTPYVLNLCGLLAYSGGTLDMVLGDTSVHDAAAKAYTDGGGAASTPSARCFCQLLTLLMDKMYDNSQLYRDAGLRNIFLMNNVYCMLQKVRDSPPLRELLGDDWLHRHRGQIKQHQTEYLEATWKPVLLSMDLMRKGDDIAAGRPLDRHSVTNDGPGTLRAYRTASAYPDLHGAAHHGPSAKGFNTAFQELYRAQTAWKVVNTQLREELRTAVSERLIPAYRALLGEGARHVKCTVQELEEYMLDFFEGVPKSIRW